MRERSQDSYYSLLGRSLVAQELPQVRKGEVDMAALRRLDQLGGDEAEPVLADVAFVDAEPLLDVCHLGWPVVLRHCEEEGAIDLRGVGQRRLVDQRPEASARLTYPLLGVVEADVLGIGMEAPRAGGSSRAGGAATPC